MTNSDFFGDYDATDAWDSTDDRQTHLHNLWERIAYLNGDERTPEDLDAIHERAQYWHARRGTLDTHATIELDLLLEDIETVRNQT